MIYLFWNQDFYMYVYVCFFFSFSQSKDAISELFKPRVVTSTQIHAHLLDTSKYKSILFKIRNQLILSSLIVDSLGCRLFVYFEPLLIISSLLHCFQMKQCFIRHIHKRKCNQTYNFIQDQV